MFILRYPVSRYAGMGTKKPLARLEFPNSGQIINPKVEVISPNFPKLRTRTAQPDNGIRP